MASASYGGAGRADTAVIDAGLRTYMLRVYNYMTLGLVITEFAALGMYLASVPAIPQAPRKFAGGDNCLPDRRRHYLTPIGYAVYASPFKWVIMLAPLALVFGLSFGAERLRPATAQFLFWAYAALVGLSLGAIFMVFTHTSIVRVFFITAASFGALSLWGYTTSRDLSGVGSFLIMGLFGVIIAMLVNVFLQSSALQWAVLVIAYSLRRVDGVGYAASEKRVCLRRDGRRDGGAFGHHGRAFALSLLCQPVHAAPPASRTARGVRWQRRFLAWPH